MCFLPLTKLVLRVVHEKKIQFLISIVKRMLDTINIIVCRHNVVFRDPRELLL
jgi:hypothetical protein